MAQQKKKRKWIKWLVLSIILVIILLGAYACNRLQTLGNQYLNALGSSHQVERGDISVLVQASGAVSAKERREVKAPVSGVVETIYVEVGDTVAAGDSILFLSGSTAEDEAKILETELSELDRQIRMTSNMKNKNIVAPVTGRVKAVYAEVGQDTRTTLDRDKGLFLISVDDRMKVVFETDAEAEPGMVVEVLIGEKIVESTIQSVKNGQVTVVIPDDKYDLEQTASVSVKDRELLGVGVLVPNQPYYVQGPSGVVDRIRVSVQDQVTIGNTLINLTEAVYSAEYERLLEQREEKSKKWQEKLAETDGVLITAPSAGIVQAVSVSDGMTVREDAVLYVQDETDLFSLVVAVDELDIVSIEIGQTVNVVMDALSNVDYTGVVTRISGAGNYMSGVTSYDVTIEMNETDKLLPGMSARGDILIAAKSDVLLIPVGAISRRDGKTYVKVVSDPEARVRDMEAPEEIEVTLGLNDGSMAEVLSGISEGQYVLDETAEVSFGALFGGRGAMTVSRG